MKRFFQYIYVIWALLWFVLFMIAILPFVLLTTLAGKVRGGNLIYRICNVWAHCWYFVCGIRHKEVYESPVDHTRQYIFVANHISYMDIPPIVLALHQPVRVLGKYEMSRYPIFGIIYRLAVVVVDRRDAERRARSVRALKSALRKGISIFIFPEGTFNETGQPLKEFYDGAFRIAIETQTPIKPVLFVDSVDRMHYRGFFELTPGKNRTVFLEEIPVTGYHLSDMPTLKAKVHEAMEAGLRRYRKY